MKYLKIFENNNISKNDIVVCLNDDNTEVQVGNKYGKVLKKDNLYLVLSYWTPILEVQSINKNYLFCNYISTWNKSRFRKATAEEIEKYELEQDAKNFNL